MTIFYWASRGKLVTGKECDSQYKIFIAKYIMFIRHFTISIAAKHYHNVVGIPCLSNLPEFLNMNTTATTDRPFDAHVATIRNIFLDFNTKMQSPGSIIPVAIHHDKAAILGSFSTLKMQMINAVATLDLTHTCKSF